MKTILTFVGGGERDEVILQTALAAAIPLSAHVDCLHAHVPSALAARHANLDFAHGEALTSALGRLRTDAHTFSTLAANNFRAFCASSGIEMRDGPTGAGQQVTARFFEEPTNEPERLRFHASQRDLVVMGRARQKQGLAPDTLEHIVRHSGRPVLAAGSAAPRTLTDTIMVCWKDADSTAAAVTDAAPLLAKARRVVFVSVAKHDGGLAAAMATAQDLAGLKAEVQVIPASRASIQDALALAAEKCGADLLVIGAYGRSRGREILFGSCTDKLLACSDRPILLRH